MTTRTLQDRVRSFKTNLGLLAVSPGYIDLKENAAARSFYEYWATLNKDCISAGFEDGGGDFSFVAEQLDRVLKDFPGYETKADVTAVFPLSFPGSGFLFGSYVTALERVVKTRLVPA